jgi:hypothetical protein
MARTLLERNGEILARLRDLRAMERPVAELLEADKRDQLLHGKDRDGVPFRPVAEATMGRRGGGGPPLAPRYQASRIITRYVARVRAEGTRLLISAGWPGLSWVRYHITGTRHMPRRDPSGIRPAAMDRVRALVRDYLFREG